MSEQVERETMEFDVVIVGAGPAGLAAAIRLKQLAAERDKEVSVVVLEKGSEVGAHGRVPVEQVGGGFCLASSHLRCPC